MCTDVTATITAEDRCPRCLGPYRFDFSRILSDPQCLCDDNPPEVARRREERRFTRHMVNQMTGHPVFMDNEAEA